MANETTKTKTEVFKTGKVAEMLKVSPATVRRLADDIAPRLSPRTGKQRTFSTDDIVLLKRAQKLRGDGHTSGEILRLLHTLETETETPTAELAKSYGDVLTIVDTVKNAQNLITARADDIVQEHAKQAKVIQAQGQWIYFLAGLSIAAFVLAIIALVVR